MVSIKCVNCGSHKSLAAGMKRGLSKGGMDQSFNEIKDTLGAQPRKQILGMNRFGKDIELVALSAGFLQ